MEGNTPILRCPWGFVHWIFLCSIPVAKITNSEQSHSTFPWKGSLKSRKVWQIQIVDNRWLRVVYFWFNSLKQGYIIKFSIECS